MIRIGCKKGGVTMNSNKEISSVSLNELKEFVQQFAPVIPEEKQLIIYDTIEQVETSGGIQTKEINPSTMESNGSTSTDNLN